MVYEASVHGHANHGCILFTFVSVCGLQQTVRTTDIQQRSQNLRNLDLGMGLKVGSSGFPRNHNHCGSSDVYVACMYCGLSMRQTGIKCRVAHEDRERTCFAFTHACVIGKHLKIPRLSYMAVDAITQGGSMPLHRFGISCIYLWQGCKYPNWSSMIDDTITWHGIASQGSPFHIYVGLDYT